MGTRIHDEVWPLLRWLCRWSEKICQRFSQVVQKVSREKGAIDTVGHVQEYQEMVVCAADDITESLSMGNDRK